MKFIAFVLASLVPGLAHAEPPARDNYVGGGLVAGFDHFLYGGLAAEAGFQIWKPMFLHVMVHGGDLATSSATDGSYMQGRIGLEARACSGFACISGGLDIGGYRGEHPRVDYAGAPMAGTQASLIVVPRVALDAGRTLRLRTALEVPVHLSPDTWGLAFTLGLVVGF